MSSAEPSFHCDCRAKSIRNVVIISLAVGLVVTLLRGFAFRGQPTAQAACGIVIGLAIVTYGTARFLDRDRMLPSAVYAIVIAAGAMLTALWTSRLF